MRNTTDKRKKKGAILCAALVIGVLGLFLGAILFPLAEELRGDIPALWVFGIYGLFIAAVIVGVILALGQRLKEIEGGEEADAKKY